MEILSTWKCERCGYIAEKEKFFQSKNQQCPKCNEEDDLFPYRMFRCLDCGYTAPQVFWFSELDLDENPLESPEHIQAEWCPSCPEVRSYDFDVDDSVMTYPRLTQVPIEIS